MVEAQSPNLTVTITAASPQTPAFELLESKLLEPQVRDEIVPRDPLIGLLEDSGAPVVYISAGPGWGKTTLLAQWASRSPRPFAWVSHTVKSQAIAAYRKLSVNSRSESVERAPVWAAVSARLRRFMPSA